MKIDGDPVIRILLGPPICAYTSFPVDECPHCKPATKEAAEADTFTARFRFSGNLYVAPPEVVPHDPEDRE